MKTAKPLLGETTDRNCAFPGIATLEVSIVQDRWGHYTSKASQREAHYTLSNIPKYHRCTNPRCQQGGLDLQEIALYLANGEHALACRGHEGSPAGRRQGDPCDNTFVVTIQKAEKGREHGTL